MSFQAMTWAVSQECGSAAAKLVLIMLANHTNGHTGQCNPRHKMLAAECEMRPETLKDHLRKLAERGLVTIVPQFAEGVQLPNHYLLNLLGGGGDFHPQGGGEVRTGGGGDFHPPYNQEYNQENKQEEKTPRKRSAPAAPLPCPPDVDVQVWTDWLALRKAKKAPVTATVLKGAQVEAGKAGMSLEAFLSAWCRRGSQGLEAAWLKPEERVSASHQLKASEQTQAQREARAANLRARLSDLKD